jgi:hypothetical protein
MIPECAGLVRNLEVVWERIVWCDGALRDKRSAIFVVGVKLVDSMPVLYIDKP